MNKKAQITLFIIIGLMIVITLGVFYSFISAPKIEEGELDTTAIEEYVTACLDRTAKEALIRLGEQGGYLFEEYMPDSPKPEPTGDLLLVYAITKPHLFTNSEWSEIMSALRLSGLNIANPFPSDEDYPWETFPYKNHQPTFKGYFGINRLVALTKEYGEMSVQAQLEKNIKENLAVKSSCLNLSSFEEKGYDIKKGSLSVNSTITENSIVFDLNLPLEIRKGSQKRKISKFSVESKIRLKKIYEFARYLIINDITDITFNITDQTYQGLIVLKDSQIKKPDDLIIIMDSDSIIDGKPYVFQFLRENRKPALHKDATAENCNGRGFSFDPDEDKLQCTCYDKILRLSDLYKSDTKEVEEC